MTDQPSKLEALGEILEVQDDTGEIAAGEARKAVGEVLRGGTPAVPTADPSNAGTADPSHAGRATPPTMAAAASPTRRDTPTPPRTPLRPPSDAGADRPGPGAGHRHRGHRTSANLPMPLVDRLVAAKQRRRWELSELVASALDHVRVDDEQVDDLLERIWSEPRVQRAYQLSPDDTIRLDTLAQRWRMNRSQVLAVVLPAELDRLGL